MKFSKRLQKLGKVKQQGKLVLKEEERKKEERRDLPLAPPFHLNCLQKKKKFFDRSEDVLLTGCQSPKEEIWVVPVLFFSLAGLWLGMLKKKKKKKKGKKRKGRKKKNVNPKNEKNKERREEKRNNWTEKKRLKTKIEGCEERWRKFFHGCRWFFPFFTEYEMMNRDSTVINLSKLPEKSESKSKRKREKSPKSKVQWRSRKEKKKKKKNPPFFSLLF